MCLSAEVSGDSLSCRSIHAKESEGSTRLGNSTSVSGNDQNQIGGSGTTTYTYGVVQDRSDIRDKADITDIPIGVNFIMISRKYDFKPISQKTQKLYLSP